MKKPKFGTILLAMAALVNLARWTGLYVFSNHAPAWVSSVITILDTLSGLFTGVAIAGGLTFVSHRLGSLQPFTPKGRLIMRFWGTAVSELAILIMSAFLLPPYVRMTMPDELRMQITDVNSWSVMAVLVGDLIIVAIALADAKSAGFTRSPAERSAPGRSAKGSGRSANGSKKQAIVSCRYWGAGCKRTGTQNGMNAHAGKCPFKPTTMLPEDAKKKESVST